MKKPWMLFLLVTLTIIAPSLVRAEDPKPQDIRIEATDFQFKTSKTSLEAMRPTTLTFVNTGKYRHELESDLFHGVESKIEVDGVMIIGDEIQELILDPGKTLKLTFVPRTKGVFEFSCNAEDPENHLKKGMKGSIKVE